MVTDQPTVLDRQFPPQVLREYAMLADGARAALIGPRGDIGWLCAPRWDSEAVCSHLVGGPGIYAITPTERFVWGGHYQPRSLIWRSRWITDDGVVESREALAHPGDEHRLVLMRQVDALQGETSMSMIMELSAGFGQSSMRDLRREGAEHWTFRVGELSGRLSAPDVIGQEQQLVSRFVLRPGQHLDFVLELSDRALPDPPDPDQLWSSTENAWLSDVPTFDNSAAPRDSAHAYAVLRGMTSPGGGMVAAATLGLPERARAGKNYDYRYAWIRDQAYAGIACSIDRPLALLDDALDFTTARLLEHGDDIAPGYRIDGSDIPGETTADLPGYPGGEDVVGNWVRGQFQLDAIGEMLQLLAGGERFDRLQQQHVDAVGLAIDVIERRWQQPEAGIWELDNSWWTQSRLAVVAGLRAVGRQFSGRLAARAATLGDAVLAETSRRCLSPGGYWQRSPSHPGVDASLLLAPVRGGLPADDPRTVATLGQVEHDLVQEGHVYRYRADDRPLGEAEGAFTLCGFVMSLAQLHQGRRTTAFRYFDIQRTVCGPPGLLTEEFDVRQRQLRGNIPQAFVHAMLLECSQVLGSAI